MKIKKLTEIMLYFKELKALDKRCAFACFDSDMFSYQIKIGDILHEITFIAEDTLLNKMTIRELLNLKKIEYFDLRSYHNNKVVKEIMYSSKTEETLN